MFSKNPKTAKRTDFQKRSRKLTNSWFHITERSKVINICKIKLVQEIGFLQKKPAFQRHDQKSEAPFAWKIFDIFPVFANGDVLTFIVFIVSRNLISPIGLRLFLVGF